MNTAFPHPFNPDRPIQKIEDDLLGRAEIARSIATAIRNWNGQDALVMALYGGWGDGKSSLKGMMIDALKKEGPNCPFVVVFNPWEWTDSQQLSRAFFEEIANQIADQGIGKEKKQSKQCATALRKLGKRLTFGGTFLDSVSYAAALVSPDVAIGAKALGKALKKSGEVSQKASEAVEDPDSSRNSGLLAIKQELRTALGKLNRPVLVLVDDVDRLAAEEVKLLFQLVKANSDFPNLIFFMFFQRDIIEACLEQTIKSGNGRAFLEKIIQVGLQLPQIQQPMLDGFLEKRLDDLLARYEHTKNFDKDYWRQTYDNCLRPYFKNLRDINRFFSTFEFLIPLFSKPTALEVNLVDLFAVEVLRVFQPDAYNAIATSRSIIFDGGTTFDVKRIDSDTATNLADITDQVFKTIPPDKAQQAKNVFNELFPVNWYRSNNGKYAQDLRVCSQEYFDRYFKWCVPQGDLSQADLNDLLSYLGNREKLAAKLRKLNDVSLGIVALERLRIFAGRFKQADAEAFAAALFDVGDEMARTPYSPNQRNTLLDSTHDLITAHFASKKEPKTYFEILQRAMSTSKGLYLPFMVTVREYFTRGQNRNNQGTPEQAMINDLKSFSTDKIKTAAQNGTLQNLPRLQGILSYWKLWGNPDDVRQFCESIVNKRPLVLIEAFFIKHPDPVSEITDQNDFLDLDLLSVSIKNLKPNLKTTREKDLCDLFENLFKDYRRKQSIHSDAGVVPATT